MASSPAKELKIFLCSAHEDQDLCEQLESHLAYLRRCYSFSIWSDSQIIAGKKWKEESEKHLNSADLILLMISSDFLASNHCYNEMQDALERYAHGETSVVSVLLRPVFVENAPFTRIRILPNDNNPLTLWQNRDAAFQNICTSINEMILRLLYSQKTAEKWIEEEDNTSYEHKRFKEAIRICNQAIRRNPNNAAAYSKKGWALCELRCFREAIPVLEKAIRLNPNDALAHLNKGWALYELKHFKEAIGVLEEAIRLNSNNAIAFLIKGQALRKLKRFEEAIGVLEEAICLDPYLDVAYFIKGQALRKLERFEEAIPVFEEAIRLNPYLDVVYSNTGNAPWNHKVPQFPHISRRAFMVGLAVVTGVSVVGGGLAVLLSSRTSLRSSSHPIPNFRIFSTFYFYL